jgi:hypothetical protein
MHAPAFAARDYKKTCFLRRNLAIFVIKMSPQAK